MDTHILLDGFHNVKDNNPVSFKISVTSIL